jgi:hypothetical protein
MRDLDSSQRGAHLPFSYVEEGPVVRAFWLHQGACIWLTGTSAIWLTAEAFTLVPAPLPNGREVKALAS